MDPRERTSDPLLSLDAALKGAQAKIWTTLPGIYQGPGTGKGTANVQAAIMGRLRDPSGKMTDVAISVCQDCPILWPGAGGFLMTFPLTANVTEGLLFFSARCIDAWWQAGGVQKQADLRMHDLSDGFFFPSPCGQKTAPASASSNSAQFRSQDGSTYVEIAGGQIVNIVAPGGAKITGNLTVTGAITASQNITAGLGGADQVTLQGHKHAGVQTGAGTSLAPTAGT